MTLEERVAKANYIYASPIKWGLKKYICSVSYYKTEPIDDLSWVICSVLNINGGSYEKRSLGVLLGFSMMDVVVDDKTTSYVDIAEINLFEDILKRIENEHLIQVSESYVNLTKLGKVALEEKKLFYFYNGYKNLYEHLSLKSSKSDLKYYPFYKDLGIATVLSNDGQYWPDDDLIPEIIHPKESSLLERLLLQSNQNNNIFKASQGEYFDIEEKTIEARLYKDENGYFPVLMNGENIAKEVTNILWSKENSLLYENIVLECRFKKLWDDNDTVLNYNTLKPFFELVDFEDLTQDKRTVWTDEDLLDVIVKRSNANCWINISKFCDLNVIKQHMLEFVTKLNWQQITRRVDDEYLIKTFKKLPWDLEVLSQDIERDNSTIEELIVIGKNSEEDWDWDELQSRLSDNFVLSNLDKVKLDLAKFTSDTIEVRKSILAFPNGMWDWNKIVNDFGLDFLLSNISILSSHIDLTKLFDRVFIDIDWTKKFLCNDKLLISVSDNIQNGGKLSSFLANDKPYVWTSELIDWMEKEGFVFWNSNEYTKGLETNPYLNWTYDFFSRYWVKVSSQEGVNIISSTIQDVSIINDFQKFNWNWDLLSSNVALLKQKNFLNWYKYKLNWENVLTYIPDIKNVQELNGIDKLIGENENAWKTFSSKADLQFVKFNYTYPWNWSILTSRLFNELKLNNLGNPVFVKKWDWTYLSSHVKIDFLKSNAKRYSGYWDWNIVFGRLLTDENKDDINSLDKFANLISNIEDKEKCEKAWTAFTKQFSFKDLLVLIPETQSKGFYLWNLADFCTRKEFDVFTYLEKYRNFIDWEALSSSENVNEQFKYSIDSGITHKKWNDKVLNVLTNIKNKWDFMKLSHLSSLCANYEFLSIFKDRIDWEYISQYSPYFAVGNDRESLRKRILPYREYVSFELLSLRNDIDTTTLIHLFPKEEYNYNTLIAKGEYKVTQEDIEIYHPYYKWDWRLVSESESFVPTAKFMLSHIDENINWRNLSKRGIQSLWSSEAIIVNVAQKSNICKDIDWYKLSSLKYFPITTSVFLNIPLAQLNWELLSTRIGIVGQLGLCENYIDWTVLSDNRALDVQNLDILDKYRDRLNWSVICRRIDFHINNTILDKFSNYVDWNAASASEDIEFSKQLVEKYENRWNWPILIKNKACFNRVKLQDFSEAKNENIIQFIRCFSEFKKRPPKAYHFTHMSNAIKIIRSQKIMSRNLANGCFDNSAGAGVISRTNKAHRFARFYYRPGTPTQFYNEFLGKDHTLEYYNSAVRLGLPKCPMPVFFVFDIEEIVSTFPNLCYYSNGNMQKDATSYFKIIDNPKMIDGIGVYDNYNKDAKQQEFLVDGELDFSKLSKIDIFCCDEEQCELLKNAVKGSPLVSRISVNTALYEFTNKQLQFNDSDEEVEISSNYDDSYEFRISYDDEVPIVINKENVSRQKGKNIYVNNMVDIRKDVPFRVFFEVSQPRIGSWLIYDNK